VDDRNGSVEPALMVVQDIVDRLLAIEAGPRGWTDVRCDAIAEIELLRTNVDESTAALARALMALMCKADDIVRLRADIERLQIAGDRVAAALNWHHDHSEYRCEDEYALCDWQEARRA